MVYEEVVEIVSGLQGELTFSTVVLFRFNNSSMYFEKETSFFL